MSQGRADVWLSRRGRRLNESLTFREAGVREDETLTIHAEMYHGPPHRRGRGRVHMIPGLGTLILSACPSKCNCDAVLLAILQMLTAPIFGLGWFWSLWFGYLIYEKGG